MVAADSSRRIVEGLLRPAAYPHGPASVELRETHISWVFLAGDRVYKVKKPVRLGFLDYGSVEARRHFCAEEIRLNRRLAPDVYLGVVPIVARGDGWQVAPGSAETRDVVVEHAVEMRRLDDAVMLPARLLDGSADRRVIEGIAKRIATFHAVNAPIAPVRFGSPDAIGENLLGNVEMAGRFGATLFPAGSLATIGEFFEHNLAAQRELLERRLATGCIRDGHGDLRAEHVVLESERPVGVIDCVEFNEGLRTVDRVSDLAFLVMDLEAHGEPGLARDLVRSYAAASHDDDLEALLPLYATYRALVRAKVDAIKAGQDEVSEPERQRAALLAQSKFGLARRYAGASGQRRAPALIVVCGPAGSGKSTMARRLVAETGFAWERSDVWRKRLAGIAPTAHLREEQRGSLYTTEANERTYTRLLTAAAARVTQGDGVVLDATFRDPSERRAVTDLAIRLGVPLVVCPCRASEREVVRRLALRREDREEVSDAGPEIYRAQRAAFETLTGFAPDVPVVPLTDGDVETTVSALLETLGTI